MFLSPVWSFYNMVSSNVKQKNQGKKLFAESFFGTPFAVGVFGTPFAMAAKMACGPPPMPKRQPASFLGSAACFLTSSPLLLLLANAHQSCL